MLTQKKHYLQKLLQKKGYQIGKTTLMFDCVFAVIEFEKCKPECYE